MYSIPKAAAMLGISQRTVIRWLEQCGIERKIIQTDRKRTYITHNDMDMLIDHLDQKVTKSINRKKQREGRNTQDIVKEGDQYTELHLEDGLYSLASVSSLLGVSKNTLRMWILQHNIEKETKTSDRKRVYISRDNILLLANLHRCKMAKKGLADITVQRDENTVGTQEGNKLYSLAEVAQLLNASPSSVRRWITQYNIGKKRENTDRSRACITYNDILTLADLCKRKIVHLPSPVNLVEEVKEIKSKLKELASEIEDIKHDLRLFVKRSIYIG
jgi:DNA-binding transcriptional MerR regulator